MKRQLAQAERIEHWPLDRLKPYARNARTHSDAQVDRVAASIAEFGFTNPILVDSSDGIIAGHCRLMAAQRLSMETVPVVVLDYLTDTQRRAYILADNQLATLSGWDEDILAAELADLQVDGFDLELTGFNEDELADLLADDDEEPQEQAPLNEDKLPEVEADAVSCEGDVWILGCHRVMCGDSTRIDHVERLMAGEVAQLLHADPPYGMGKQADGVANDNLYEEDLDRFQMEWWVAFRAYLSDNASAYIWGNAPDLWRLWYRGGLGASERLELRNEIVWDKKAIPGMASPGLTQYPEASERCLFFQVGDQFRGNINTADFPESWEGVRSYMHGEAERAGITSADIKRVCGCGMYSHWFTKSQFTLIPEKHYRTLAEAYPGRFSRPWAELKAEWDEVKSGPTSQIQQDRSYFDNAHDVMRDVWEFPRVTGDERHGHATPKPVAMMERVMRSSLPPGGLCAEPFGGSGSTLIGAEKSGRRCFSMELQGRYVDVIVRRWENLTGRDAVLEETGQTFADIEAGRYTEPVPANENEPAADEVA